MRLMQVEAVIRKEKFPDVDVALRKIGVSGLTVTESKGRGRDKLTVTWYARGKWSYSTEYIPRVVIDIVCKQDDVDVVIKAITDAASTGAVGDGKILVLPVQMAIDIGSAKPEYFPLHDRLER